ncbi:cytochrome b [Larsenimonas rhizosphaerae]|uniref:Cytochrome b n=1 Tax=Larsenimonas rhizosphaerae TaxID=2944682 RepID=A0AA42CVR4_9GAMM|nr:cytochrome b [Larsenimonas rhizosphaerae]MCM2131485.1 cytochrome b [Larsenimonas rhizosphaerae]MCX2525201.1 cytochrome b [Larsenimonas rhizosphaerae]
MSLLTDNRYRYGLVSRMFHWSMAALLFWQIGGIVISELFSRNLSWVSAWRGTHFSVGVLILALALMRAVWGLMSFRNRPRALDKTGKWAAYGHMALYGFMLVTPVLGLLLVYGAGKPLVFFGGHLWGVHDPLQWAYKTGDLLHGVMAWTFLAAIAGHMSMVIYHHYVLKDATLSHMVGKPKSDV